MQFTSTPRGARLARRLVSRRLDEWGYPYGSDINDTATLIAAELTSNAIRHGHVSGRDFRLRLAAASATLRIEVTDARTEKLPASGTINTPPADTDSGRGLFLVSRFADRWGVATQAGAPNKTVWAEVRLLAPA